MDSSKKENKEEKLVQRAYYITEEMAQAITMKTMDKEYDKFNAGKSGVVRDALAEFLKDELEYIKKKKEK